MAFDKVDENGKEEEAYNRLWDSTFEQFTLGPKGVHPNTKFDLSEWQKYARKFRQAIISLSDASVLYWCRIHLSVVAVDSDTVLIHYSFENLYEEEIPLTVDARLLSITFRDIKRLWLTEDVSSHGKHQLELPVTGITYTPGTISSLSIGPSEILTVTRKARRNEDGSWNLSYFENCLPGHTYNLQLIYGGLPSNVFTWTAPE